MHAPAVDNRTEFVADPFLLVGKEGERVVLVVKATWVGVLGEGTLELATRAEQRGVRGADVPWGDPEKSSIKYPSDLCITKPGTDVIVVAAAHPPVGEEAPWFDAGVQVGPLQKTIRVFGLRVWQANGSGLSEARPAAEIEVRYDYAWGGVDASDLEKIVEEPRNPVGMGITRDHASLTHKAAPFFEDPGHLIISARTRPPPAGLGAIGRHWEPRRQHLGTHDAQWLEERAPLQPLDFDDRANLCASPGLTAVPPLDGGEDVGLVNLTPGGGAVSFRLPKIRVTAALHAPGRAPQVLTPHLDTVIIDTLEVREPAGAVVELVWRAAFVPPRRMKDATIIVTEEEIG